MYLDISLICWRDLLFSLLRKFSNVVQDIIVHFFGAHLAGLE